MMHVYVPSRSRAARSLTMEALAFGRVDRSRIWLAVPDDQATTYEPMAERYGVNILPCPKPGIAATRQHCGEHADQSCCDKFIMLDDDLRWFYRQENSVRLHKFEPKHMNQMLGNVERALDRYAHCAISARQGNNQLKYPYVENKRPLRALAYQTEVFLTARHGRVAIMEDFDVTLQLMKRGYKNLIITKYAQDQQQTQLPGGCSDYRTHALHEANVLRMARLHHPFVKVVEKDNKTGGEFGKRKEAIIYWDKAWKSSQQPNPLE